MNQEFDFCKNVNQETLGSKPLLAKSEINIICINYIRTRISN
jgi:hypothetical protein